MMRLRSPVRAGAVRVECRGFDVPPGYDTIMHVRAPRGWCGEPPRFVLRAPFELVAAARDSRFSDPTLRLQVHNGGQRTERALVGVDFCCPGVLRISSGVWIS